MFFLSIEQFLKKDISGCCPQVFICANLSAHFTGKTAEHIIRSYEISIDQKYCSGGNSQADWLDGLKVTIKNVQVPTFKSDFLYAIKIS